MTTRPRTADTERLVLSHFTLARDHPIEDRIAAAAAAGFVGIGLFAGQYRQLLADGWSAGRLHELLDDAGVSMMEAEALAGWGARHPSDAYVDFERFVWEMVDEFDVPYVQAIGPVDLGADGSFADAATRFGELCDRAATHGATVGLEFLPFTNIVDAADALAIVEAAGRPNGGVCVDIWHHTRGADDLGLIARIPPELIVGVQMSDGPAAPIPVGGRLDDHDDDHFDDHYDYKDDCLRHRVPPGEGTFDVDGFVTLLLDLGVDRPWDLEVCNEDAWGRPAIDHVTACATGMRTVLERCLAARAARTSPARPPNDPPNDTRLDPPSDRSPRGTDS
jgi:sugar phosphate isomerase/epimerase